MTARIHIPKALAGAAAGIVNGLFGAGGGMVGNVGKSTAKETRSSVIFGENVPGAVDYICLVIAIAGIAAAIVGPVLHHKKKKAALLARLEQENPEAAAVLKR